MAEENMEPYKLNERAARLCDTLESQAAELRIGVSINSDVTRLMDFGVAAPGGLEAGLALARICLADLGQVAIVPRRPEFGSGPAVQVRTDHPLAACMASQYAGWQIAQGKYFAMCSGPIRAAYGREKLFDTIGLRETSPHLVGVLEASQLPPVEVCEKIAADCGLEAYRLTLAIARTASMAGTMQVVARSVETALHKLLELGFDLTRVASGYGVVPLPPIARDDLSAIGWTNDAILYGCEVTLYVRGDDDTLADLGPKVPSAASADYGEPFASIFARYDRDFYKIDPLLFSPAQVTFVNLDSGRTHTFGQLNPAVLAKSFGAA
jgi:methenyltetrahydromethanopterin cyclohydrolase